MDATTRALCSHPHAFHTASARAERGTRAVLWITLAAMAVEIAAGWWFNSMALMADGWHMSSHALAIGLSAAAYAASRRYAHDGRFAFGTWKIEVLAGFASALLLVVVAALMAVASIERLLSPMAIRYPEAIAVAVLGLAVNLVCALILGRSHDHHHHGHDPGHDHAHHGHAHHDHHGHHAHHAHDAAHSEDLNLKSAYVHVLTDAFTSVLAIVALLGGWLQGWGWLDPVMGIAGALVVAWWARGLLAQTARVLLDREMDAPLVARIRASVDDPPGGTQLTDLHVWRVGAVAYAAALSVQTRDPALTPAALRARLAVHDALVHTTIEVHHTPPA